ncbi:MAG: amidase, partial [Pseudomonadales bacterium]|nr:amidase [Pseudomonadales bacterium]
GAKFLKEASFVADHDSYFTEKISAAGFVTIGKTNTPEFGLTVTTEPECYGPTRNPWNTEHSSGGSSGGSAAAVAAGAVPAAHAGDGGGSIRIPASECGLVGLKPSRGRVSLGPDYGEYWQGCVISHVVTKSVRDSAAILDAVSGCMPGDPYAAPTPLRPYAQDVGVDPGALRIGIMAETPAGTPALDEQCKRAVESAASRLGELGHRVESSFPAPVGSFERTFEVFSPLVSSWVAASLDEWGEVLGRELTQDDVEGATWALAEIGRAISAAQYVGTAKKLAAYTRDVAAWWESGFDVLVTPTIAAPPPKLGALTPSPDDPEGGGDLVLRLIPYTPPFNMTGQPAVSLPLHWSDDGLPIGIQLVAAYGREDVLIRLAAQLEEAMPWRDRRPPVFAG